MRNRRKDLNGLVFSCYAVVVTAALFFQLKRRKTMANCQFLFNCWMKVQGIYFLKDIHVDLDAS